MVIYFQGETMKIIWLNKNSELGIVSFTKSNLTLNKIASTHFKDVEYVMVGLDKEEKKLYIKPIDNNLLVRGDLDKEELFKISISKTYDRISSVVLINLINEVQDVTNKKFYSKFNEKEEMLIIDLNKEVK